MEEAIISSIQYFLMGIQQPTKNQAHSKPNSTYHEGLQTVINPPALLLAARGIKIALKYHHRLEDENPYMAITHTADEKRNEEEEEKGLQRDM